MLVLSKQVFGHKYSTHTIKNALYSGVCFLLIGDYICQWFSDYFCCNAFGKFCTCDEPAI